MGEQSEQGERVWHRCVDLFPHPARVVWVWPGYGEVVPARLRGIYDPDGSDPDIPRVLAVLSAEIIGGPVHCLLYQKVEDVKWSGDGWPEVPDPPEEQKGGER